MITDAVTGAPESAIQKTKGRFLTEFLTDADTFTVDFPEGANTDLKVLLIGATILIDFLYFEN